MLCSTRLLTSSWMGICSSSLAKKCNQTLRTPKGKPLWWIEVCITFKFFCLKWTTILRKTKHNYVRAKGLLINCQFLYEQFFFWHIKASLIFIRLGNLSSKSLRNILLTSTQPKTLDAFLYKFEWKFFYVLFQFCVSWNYPSITSTLVSNFAFSF